MSLAKWSEPASADLDEIWAFSAEHDLELADRRIDRLRARVRQLERLPFSGPVVKGRLRKLSATPYVLYYELKGGQVTVLRVIHSARNFDPLTLL